MEGAGADGVMEADPEGITRAAEHQAVGEGLLETVKMYRDVYKGSAGKTLRLQLRFFFMLINP